jgi:hypothetical protein
MITARTGQDGVTRSSPHGNVQVTMTKPDRDELLAALRVMQELCWQFGSAEHMPFVATINGFEILLEKTR